MKTSHIVLYTICAIILFIGIILNAHNKQYMINKQYVIKEPVFTKEYETYWISQNNTDNLFYDPHTFGLDLFNNSCQIMSLQNFRKYINSNIKCNGKWCYKNYHCMCYDSRSCYNVEHILDKKGKEFSNCNKDIVGNYVMAWGKWNQKLGRVAYQNYYNSIKEKEQIYGLTIVNRVREHFRKCCSIFNISQVELY